MKESYTYEIIKQFYTETYPPEVEEKIQRWIIRDEWTTEKENALSTLWSEIEIAPNECTYKALEKVKSTIKHVESTKRHLRIRHVLLSSAAAIIPVLLLLSCYFYINRDVKLLEVVTSSNQQKQCTLPDGTTVLLNSCTKVTYPSKFKDSTRMITLVGEAYFSVASDAAKPFIVKTNKLSIRVLGTKFNISAYPTNDRIIATLNSGKIQVDIQSKKADSRYFLKPNQEIVFNKTDESVSVNSITSEDIYWKDGSLVFQDATVNDILNAVERRYGIIIDNRQGLHHIPYTLKFRNNESLEEVLNILQEVVGFEYKREKNRITIIQKGGNR